MGMVPILLAHGLEKAELRKILASRLFSRAPTLSKMLAYICEMYFVGQADHIKEYNVAVEALGRGPDFDSGGDSIVRVEAARLRKHLEQYYATEDAGSTLRLRLADVGYAPGSSRSPHRKRWTCLGSRMPRSNPIPSLPPRVTNRKTRQQFHAGIREWRWPLLWR